MISGNYSLSSIEPMTLSVIIPVYNENSTIREIIDLVLARPEVNEVVLVDDFSTDGTREILSTMEGREKLTIRFHPHNRGKGAALRTGFAAATCDIVLIQDADMESTGKMSRKIPNALRVLVTSACRFHFQQAKTRSGMNINAHSHSKSCWTLKLLCNTSMFFTKFQICPSTYKKTTVKDAPAAPRGTLRKTNDKNPQRNRVAIRLMARGTGTSLGGTSAVFTAYSARTG